MLIPTAHVEFVNDLSNEDVVTAVFTASPIPSFVFTRDRESTWRRADRAHCEKCGLSALISEQMSAYVRYDAEFGRSDFDIHHVTGGLRVNF